MCSKLLNTRPQLQFGVSTAGKQAIAQHIPLAKLLERKFAFATYKAALQTSRLPLAIAKRNSSCSIRCIKITIAQFCISTIGIRHRCVGLHSRWLQAGRVNIKR